ncbi:hypothetical protein K493DRAFT_302868 [Basidiobolus meristosporus CBS 931.73]|uniref:Uncharacterized protein n=1 Tax=Basidiobolus meristosporus CBS 931.73 TaxID=1314790 RepID=A0A1Y1Y5B1_9FUNG|nr:hypothetical protein K493DRAFT_302868 [Basidiobolus meristosporus CBS 931.73]|eukprot:ORX93173.1 hypothetical protein K493DRAFT_302868 [Basidiobolus meristosporus CBS 931.73]
MFSTSPSQSNKGNSNEGNAPNKSAKPNRGLVETVTAPPNKKRPVEQAPTGLQEESHVSDHGHHANAQSNRTSTKRLRHDASFCFAESRLDHCLYEKVNPLSMKPYHPRHTTANLERGLVLTFSLDPITRGCSIFTPGKRVGQHRPSLIQRLRG